MPNKIMMTAADIMEELSVSESFAYGLIRKFNAELKERKRLKSMEKFITDERTGLQYELVGDYYLLAGDDPEQPHIGVFSQRSADCNLVSEALTAISRFFIYDSIYEKSG